MKKVKHLKNAVAAMTVSSILIQIPGVFAVPVDRKTIKLDYQWNLSDIYKTKSDFNKAIDTLRKKYFAEIKTYKGKLNNPDSLLKCLQLQDDIGRYTDTIYVYSHMLSNQDQTDSSANELASTAETISSDSDLATAFIQPELLSYPVKYINDCIKNPKFADYKHYLNSILLEKPHTLSKDCEELLASAGDMAESPNSIYTQITTADMTFPTIKDSNGKDCQLSEAGYGSLLESADRSFRKRAFEGILSSYMKSQNSLASTLNAEVKKNVFFAKARKYNSSLEASLADENIPVSVYTNLVNSVDKNLGYLNKYISLRKKVLGLDKVHSYDMYVPLVGSYKFTVPYDEGKKMVTDGLSILGKDYISNFTKGLNSRWIDVFETPNKYTGSYQWGSYDTHPYVLLNYDNTADSVLTLAHEMGHAMNSFYTNKTQKYVNSDIPIFNAEIASTANELLMNHYLINHAKSDNEKLYFLNTLAEDIRGTVYTQVMFAEFEKAIHDKVETGGGLSADTLNTLWTDLMSKYYGKDYQIDPASKVGWARIPHFYMDFYVYKYATAISAANQLVKNIEAKKPNALNNYMKFLSAGSSDYPIDILKKAGVDMTKPAAVDSLLSDFNDIVGQMEQILKKDGKIK